MEVYEPSEQSDGQRIDDRDAIRRTTGNAMIWWMWSRPDRDDVRDLRTR